MLALLGLHALLASLAVALPRLGRRALALCALAPLAALGWAAVTAGGVLGGRPVVERAAWAPGLGLELGWRMDAFGLLMLLLVAGVGVLVLGYSAWYTELDAPDLGRFAGYLTLFAGSMLGLVLADNVFMLYVCWELTSVSSYLLIGFESQEAEARSAALQALLVTTLGGLAMLAGLVLIGQAAGSWSLSEILARPPSGAAVGAGLALVLLGAFTKSAQVPLHGWLPAAMVAPTPVSAYLHAAAMVKAGVYLVARLAPAFAAVGFWRPTVVVVGLASMLVGGWRALRETDLKRLLAYGTISQLGLLTVLFGIGVPEVTAAGAAMLLAHALFKAALFLVTGIVDHQAGTRDLRRLSGVGRRLPGLLAVAALAAASMAGLPPLLGYLAKEEAYGALLDAAEALGALGTGALAGVVAGSVLTFAYSARFVLGGFGGREAAGIPRPAAGFTAAPALLSVAGLAGGLLPGLTSGLLVPAAAALDPEAPAEPLALWHGLTPALALGALTIALGAAVAAGWRAERGAPARPPRLSEAERAYRAGFRALLRGAGRLTGVIQSGSLPAYLGIVLLTVLLLPGTALTTVVPRVLAAVAVQVRDPLIEEVRLYDTPVQLAVELLLVVAAVGVAVTRQRLVAALLLGVVGYGVAVLFVTQGAPDIALTQILVETLTLVAFVLALRHLPNRFVERRWPLGQVTRVVIAATVGLFVAAFAVVTASVPRGAEVSRAYLDRALPEAGGRNVVNTILTDFRAYDTLGEITVLAAAALGITSMVILGRRAAGATGGIRPRGDDRGEWRGERGGARRQEADERQQARPEVPR